MWRHQDSIRLKAFRTRQYFEIFANRGIYKDGWRAASLAFEPWQSERGDFDPLAAEWELYLRGDGTAAVLTLMSNPVCPSSVEEHAVELPELTGGGCSGASLTAMSRLII